MREVLKKMKIKMLILVGNKKNISEKGFINIGGFKSAFCISLAHSFIQGVFDKFEIENLCQFLAAD